MKKQTRNILITLLVIGVLIGVLIFLGTKGTGFGKVCALGDWQFSSYDSVNKIFHIPVSVGQDQRNAGGSDSCVGAHAFRSGTTWDPIAIITNSQDCVDNGFLWRNADGSFSNPDLGTGGPDYPKNNACYATNIWFDGKNYTIKVTCTHTVCEGTFPQAYAGVPCTETRNDFTFDGFQIEVPNLIHGNSDIATCTGEILVYGKNSNTASIFPISASVNSSTAQDSTSSPTTTGPSPPPLSTNTNTQTSSTNNASSQTQQEQDVIFIILLVVTLIVMGLVIFMGYKKITGRRR